MLLLVFQAGAARYGLEATRIVQVIPAAALTPLPRMPGYVSGLLNFHGTIVPVLDLTALCTGDAARVRLSSRILIVDFPAADGTKHPLGLLAERATETVLCDENDFQAAGIQTPDARFAGHILIDGGSAIQKIEIRELLTAELQQQLFSPTAGGNA